MTAERTCLIRRFYFDDAHPDNRKVIQTGLSHADAKAWCDREDTKGLDANGNPWFDGWEWE